MVAGRRQEDLEQESRAASCAQRMAGRGPKVPQLELACGWVVEKCDGELVERVGLAMRLYRVIRMPLIVRVRAKCRRPRAATTTLRRRR